MDEWTDEELIAQARAAGSEDQRRTLVEHLFVRHYQRVALWCLRWSRDRDEARDLAQEIFLKIYRTLDSFEGSAKFTTWLYMVCRNHCINAGRSRWRKDTEGISQALEAALHSPGPNPEMQLESRSRLEIAKQFLEEQLTETERKVLLLHYVEELPLTVVTGMLRLTNASGAKAYIVSGQRKLRTAVGRWKASCQRKA